MKQRVIISGVIVAVLAMAGHAMGQKDADDEPTALMNFLVLKDENSKPVRNASVIMHAVSSHGKQERGDLELKTNSEGKASFDGIPYGKLRVQVLASGFQTYGDDFDINQHEVSITIKLKRPQGQYSIYESHPEEKKDDKKEDKASPPADPNAKPQ